MSNVIKFPKIKLDTPPQTLEEVSEKIIDYKTKYADELSEILWNIVLGEMARSGCDLESNAEEIFPSMILLLESIKSLHLHSSGVYHPLQEFAEQAFEMSELDEEENNSENEQLDENVVDDQP